MHAFIAPVIFPEYYAFYDDNLESVNGSSPTGNCSNTSLTDSNGYKLTTCWQPNSSILFDWHVPTHIELSGDMWASQLLTIQSTDSRVDITSTFAFNVTIERVEVVMFTCSIVNRNITLQLFGGPNTMRYITTKHLGSVTSCDSLVRVCISVNTSDLREILMRFTSNKDYSLYLAEVIFHSHNSTCSPDAIFNSTTLLPPVTSSPDTTSPVEPSVKATTPPISMNSSSPGNVIVAAVVPISIVLVIVIIVVVLILSMVCTTKLRAKEDHITSHRLAHSHQPPQDSGHINNLCEEMGQAYYSSIHDIQREDIPADQGLERVTFELKENDAYGTLS